MRPFLNQDREGLVKPGGSKLQAPRPGLAVLRVAPGIEPGIFRGAPQIPYEQPLRGAAGGDPAKVPVKGKGDHIGVRIFAEPAEG